MPELADIPAVQTSLQAEIMAKTAAAVQDTALGADFDTEVTAAIAKDAGEAPPKETPQPTAKPKAEAAPEPAPKVADIPSALLEKKVKPDGNAKDAEQTDVEREKFIKEQTAGMSQKAADRFRAIEAKAHAAQKEAAKASKLEKDLAAANERLKSVTDTTVTDDLKRQRDELDEIVQRNAVAEHPRFKAKYDANIAKEIGIAAKLVPKEMESEVAALLSMPESKQRNDRLNDIVVDLDALASRKFFQAVDNSDRLSSERNEELSKWKENKVRLAELSAQEQHDAVANRQGQIDRAINTVIPRFTDEEKGVELFRKVEGNDEWNANVEARLDTVRKLASMDHNREDLTEMAAWALSGQEYRKLFLTQRVLVQRLQEEVSALKGGEPALGTGTGAVADDDEKGSMIDIISRGAKRAGVLR